MSEESPPTPSTDDSLQAGLDLIQEAGSQLADAAQKAMSGVGHLLQAGIKGLTSELSGSIANKKPADPAAAADSSNQS